MTTLSNGRTLVYDAWNRLVKVLDSDGVTPVAAYQYDGRNFRVVQCSYTAGTLSEVRHFYYTSDWQVVEERVEAAPLPNPTSLTLAAQYVWGLRYVDDLVCRNRDTNADATLDERLYALHDANWNVVALAATTGAIAERYTYTPYGQVTYRDWDWFEYEVQDSIYSNTVLYTGRTLDPITGLYDYRARYYDPALERFVSRDPIGYEGKDFNLYEYVGDDPITRTDPSGTIGESDLKAFWQDGKPSHFPSLPTTPAPAPSSNDNRHSQFTVKSLCERLKSNPKCAKCVADDCENVMNNLIKVARGTAAHFGPDHCLRWTDNFLRALGPNRHTSCYTTRQIIWTYVSFLSCPKSWRLRHVAARIRLCDKTVLYADDGWWAGIVFGDGTFFWPKDVSEYVIQDS